MVAWPTPNAQPQSGATYTGERRTLYHSFSARLQSLLNELLASEGIGAAQVDARAKDVQSFIDKMGRRPGRYLDPLADITDLAGVRVVVYYSSDVELVDAMIEREFAVDEKNSWRRTPSTDPDRFGYRSDHYVVSCSTSRAGLGEWQPYVGLRAEIQVRTVLQHAWAAIDHRLNYKRASEIPAELKRQLFRISALLEVADDQFESVRLAAGRLSSSYERSVSLGGARASNRSSLSRGIRGAKPEDRALDEFCRQSGLQS
jgi:putative GTP pyrophosphokinase